MLHAIRGHFRPCQDCIVEVAADVFERAVGGVESLVSRGASRVCLMLRSPRRTLLSREHVQIFQSRPRMSPARSMPAVWLDPLQARGEGALGGSSLAGACLRSPEEKDSSTTRHSFARKPDEDVSSGEVAVAVLVAKAGMSWGGRAAEGRGKTVKR